MNVAKKRTFPGYVDGPGQKRFAHTSKQDGQAQGLTTKEDACIPQQVLHVPRLPLSTELIVQKHLDACTESIWSGALKFHTRPQSQSNIQRQAMVISSCSVHSYKNINAPVNWPKQLMMHTIPLDDYKKLNDLRVKRTTQWVTFSVDEDCDKMSYRAFIQSTSISNVHCGCALVEYTSSGISLLILTSFQFRDEVVIAGHILKCTYQDCAVELLTDLGIISHATTANMLAKENASLKEEVEMQKTMMSEKEEEQARVQRERDVMQIQIIERDRALSDKEEELIERDRALSEKDEKLIEQHRALSEKDEKLSEQHRALSEKDEGLIEKDKALSEKDEKLIEQHRALSEKDQEIKAKDRALSQKQSELTVKDITLMEKEERLFETQRALSDLKQEQNELQHEQDKVEEQLQMCQRALNNAQHLDAEREKTIVQPNIEEDTDKILVTETSRLELVNEVNTKKAALDDIEEMIENEFKCSICAQLFIKTTTLNCSHSFCTFCIQKWLDEKRTCPNCRLMTTSSVRSVVIDNCIEKIVNKLGDEARQRRKETVREREETISTERYGQPYVILDDDDESDDQSSTVTSPSSSTPYLRSPASTMSTYHPSPASTMSTYHPSPASSYWRSPSSIANMFSPPSVSSTNTASPAAT